MPDRAAGLFGALTLVLLNALLAHIVKQPDGIAISGLFIVGIIVISLISRVSRTTELRADRIEFDETARRWITDSLRYDGALNIVANKRQAGDVPEYTEKEAAAREMDPVPGTADVVSLEIDVVDPSDFSDVLRSVGSTSADTGSCEPRALRSPMPSPRSCSP